MKTYEEYLAERFVNLFNDSEEERRKWAPELWNMLQATYASIGGIKGSGFESIERMITTIPFWKLIVQNGVLHGAALYKDKDGRKLVASTYRAGSEYGRAKVIDIAKNDLTRSYGEKSKAALGSLMKTVPWPILEPFMLKPKRSKSVIPIDDIPCNEIPEDGVATLKRFPELTPYAYVRLIGGDYVFKVSMGTPGQTIT